MRIQNTPFGSNPFKRGVAIITVALFLFTGLFSYAPTAFAQPKNLKVHGGNPSGLLRLARDREIRIPPELGLIDESFHGTSGKTILFIQDAHDSLEAQENIAKIISHLVTNAGVKTVFEEGYEGPVPTDKYFGFIKDPKIKEKVSWFFMDHLRLGGAEYAHINRTIDFNLVGADSLKLHKENVEQYRLSAEKKDAVTKDLKALEKEFHSLADSRFPKQLKEWLKVKEQYDMKRLDLVTYLGRTMPLLGERGAEKGFGLIRFLMEAMRTHDPVVIEKAKHIDAREVFGELAKLEETIRETCLKDATDKKLFDYYKILGLLNRLNELEVSQEEYEAVKASLKAFDTDSFARFIFSQAPKTLILSRMWERNIKDAVRFYEIAQERDHSLSQVLGGGYSEGGNKKEELVHTQDVSVLVFGGFHKEAIKRILEARGVSYLVVNPRITKPSPRHEKFYKRLMIDGMHPFEKMIRPALATATRNLTIYNGMPATVGRAEVREVYDTLLANPDRDPSILEPYLLNAPQGIQSVRSEVRIADENTDKANGKKVYSKVQLSPQTAVYPAGLDLKIFQLFPNVREAHFINPRPFRVPYDQSHLTYHGYHPGEEALQAMVRDYLAAEQGYYVSDSLQDAIFLADQDAKTPQIGVEPFMIEDIKQHGGTDIGVDEVPGAAYQLFRISFRDADSRERIVYYHQVKAGTESSYPALQSLLPNGRADLLFVKAFSQAEHNDRLAPLIRHVRSEGLVAMDTPRYGSAQMWPDLRLVEKLDSRVWGGLGYGDYMSIFHFEQREKGFQAVRELQIDPRTLDPLGQASPDDFLRPEMREEIEKITEQELSRLRQVWQGVMRRTGSADRFFGSINYFGSALPQLLNEQLRDASSDPDLYKKSAFELATLLVAYPEITSELLFYASINYLHHFRKYQELMAVIGSALMIAAAVSGLEMHPTEEKITWNDHERNFNRLAGFLRDERYALDFVTILEKERRGVVEGKPWYVDAFAANLDALRAIRYQTPEILSEVLSRLATLQNPHGMHPWAQRQLEESVYELAERENHLPELPIKLPEKVTREFKKYLKHLQTGDIKILEAFLQSRGNPLDRSENDVEKSGDPIDLSVRNKEGLEPALQKVRIDYDRIFSLVFQHEEQRVRAEVRAEKAKPRASRRRWLKQAAVIGVGGAMFFGGRVIDQSGRSQKSKPWLRFEINSAELDNGKRILEAKETIYQIIEWIKQAGFPYPDVLDNYAKKLSGPETTDDVNIPYPLAKTVDLPTKIIMNSKMFGESIEAIQFADSTGDAHDVFMEIVFTIIQEAFGVQFASAFHQTTDGSLAVFKNLTEKMIDDRNKVYLSRLAGHFDRDQYKKHMAANDTAILQTVAFFLSFEIFEALMKYRLGIEWAIKKGLYSPRNAKKIYEETVTKDSKKAQTLSGPRDSVQSLLDTKGDLEKIIASQLAGFIPMAIFTGAPYFVAYDSFAQLEFLRFDNSKGVEGLDEQVLRVAMSRNLPIKSEWFLSSARRIQPLVEELLGDMDNHMPSNLKILPFSKGGPVRSELRGKSEEKPAKGIARRVFIDAAIFVLMGAAGWGIGWWRTTSSKIRKEKPVISDRPQNYQEVLGEFLSTLQGINQISIKRDEKNVFPSKEDWIKNLQSLQQGHPVWIATSQGADLVNGKIGTIRKMYLTGSIRSVMLTDDDKAAAQVINGILADIIKGNIDSETEKGRTGIAKRIEDYFKTTTPARRSEMRAGMGIRLFRVGDQLSLEDGSTLKALDVLLDGWATFEYSNPALPEPKKITINLGHPFLLQWHLLTLVKTAINFDGAKMAWVRIAFPKGETLKIRPWTGLHKGDFILGLGTITEEPVISRQARLTVAMNLLSLENAPINGPVIRYDRISKQGSRPDIVRLSLLQGKILIPKKGPADRLSPQSAGSRSEVREGEEEDARTKVKQLKVLQQVAELTLIEGMKLGKREDQPVSDQRLTDLFFRLLDQQTHSRFGRSTSQDLLTVLKDVYGMETRLELLSDESAQRLLVAAASSVQLKVGEFNLSRRDLLRGTLTALLTLGFGGGVGLGNHAVAVAREAAAQGLVDKLFESILRAFRKGMAWETVFSNKEADAFRITRPDHALIYNPLLEQASGSFQKAVLFWARQNAAGISTLFEEAAREHKKWPAAPPSIGSPEDLFLNSLFWIVQDQRLGIETKGFDYPFSPSLFSSWQVLARTLGGIVKKWPLRLAEELLDGEPSEWSPELLRERISTGSVRDKLEAELEKVKAKLSRIRGIERRLESPEAVWVVSDERALLRREQQFVSRQKEILSSMKLLDTLESSLGLKKTFTILPSSRSEVRQLPDWLKEAYEKAGVPLDVTSGLTGEDSLGEYVPSSTDLLNPVARELAIPAAGPYTLIVPGSGGFDFEMQLLKRFPDLRIIGIEGRADLYERSQKLTDAAVALGHIRQGQVVLELGNFNDRKFSRYFGEADGVYYFENGTDDTEALTETLATSLAKPGVRIVTSDEVFGSIMRKSPGNLAGLLRRGFTGYIKGGEIRVFYRKDKPDSLEEFSRRMSAWLHSSADVVSNPVAVWCGTFNKYADAAVLQAQKEYFAAGVRSLVEKKLLKLENGIVARYAGTNAIANFIWNIISTGEAMGFWKIERDHNGQAGIFRSKIIDIDFSALGLPVSQSADKGVNASAANRSEVRHLSDIPPGPAGHEYGRKFLDFYAQLKDHSRQDTLERSREFGGSKYPDESLPFLANMITVYEGDAPAHDLQLIVDEVSEYKRINDTREAALRVIGILQQVVKIRRDDYSHLPYLEEIKQGDEPNIRRTMVAILMKAAEKQPSVKKDRSRFVAMEPIPDHSLETEGPTQQRSEVREATVVESPKSIIPTPITPEIRPGVMSDAKRGQAPFRDLKKGTRLQQQVPVPVTAGIRKAVLVLLKEQIDAMSLEDYKKLLVLVATERSKIRLVVPGSERGSYNARVAELSDEVSVSYRLEVAGSGKVSVIGFANDSESELKGRLNELGENGKSIAVRIDECFAMEDGIDGIVLALLDVPPEDLARKKGLLYDSRGLFSFQVHAFVDALVRGFTVISRAA